MIDTYEAPLVIQDDRGDRFINKEKFGESFFILRMDDFPFSLGAAQTQNSNFSIPEDAGHAGDFEAAGIVAYTNVPFLMSLSEVGIEANSFMNNPIHHNLCAGFGAFPFVFAETAFFLAGRSVQTTITSLAASLTGALKIALVGRKFNSEMSEEVRAQRAAFLANRPTRPFWLTLDTTSITLTAGQQNQQAFMTMPSGSHFAAQDLLFQSTGPFEYSIFDAMSGRLLTFGQSGNAAAQGFVDSRMFGGSGALPARMLGSPLIAPRRAMRVVFNDISGATNTIYFTLHGRRMRMPVG